MQKVARIRTIEPDGSTIGASSYFSIVVVSKLECYIARVEL